MQHQRQRHDSPQREVPSQPEHAAPAAVVDARECEVMEDPLVRHLRDEKQQNQRPCKQHLGTGPTPGHRPVPAVAEPGVRYLASQDWPVASSAARARPNAMRYQANTSNERCDTKRMSHRTTTSALAKATTKPVVRIRASDPDNR